MKKIIDGKLYNTESAKEMGSYMYSGPRDFNFFKETLYRKKTGEYFIHGKGGPASKYAKTVSQNNWTGGQQIIPVSYKKAKEWAENYLEVEEYEKIFGEIQEDESHTTITITLPASLLERTKRNASEKEMTLSKYIEQQLK